MNVTVKDLLDAGLHFGHQVRRWNPKTKPYVFDNRYGISIIDLEKTYDLLEKSAGSMENIVASGKQVLLVGTKRQAQEPIREMAAATQMPYCASRWLGGTLTNFQTVSTSIAKYKNFLRMEEDGSMDKLPGKEAAAIKRQMARMSRNFEGLLDMKELPGALFVIDSRTEAIAVAEANRLEIPVCALVDSNSDPTLLDFPIPGNDDSSKSIRIVADVITEGIQTGSTNRVVVRVQKGITPVVQQEFDEGDDEPEVNLPEGYEEFVDVRRRDDETSAQEAVKEPVTEEKKASEVVGDEEEAKVAPEEAVEEAGVDESVTEEDKSSEDVDSEEEEAEAAPEEAVEEAGVDESVTDEDKSSEDVDSEEEEAEAAPEEAVEEAEVDESVTEEGKASEDVDSEEEVEAAPEEAVEEAGDDETKKSSEGVDSEEEGEAVPEEAVEEEESLEEDKTS